MNGDSERKSCNGTPAPPGLADHFFRREFGRLESKFVFACGARQPDSDSVSNAPAKNPRMNNMTASEADAVPLATDCAARRPKFVSADQNLTRWRRDGWRVSDGPVQPKLT